MTGERYWLWLAATCILCLSAVARAQNSDEPNSLGDIARQSRAQHAAAPNGNSSKTKDPLDEMQQEEQAPESAPAGFTIFDVGDYRVFVPFPFSLEGRENGGAVLLGSRLAASHTEVMAGGPMPMPPNLSDSDLRDTAHQLAQAYSQSASCESINLGIHKAFRCGLKKASLLGREVTGSIEFVVATNSLVPVMCVSADGSPKCVPRSGHRTCETIHLTRQALRTTNAARLARYHDQLTNAQVCNQIIYPSIQLKEDQLKDDHLKDDMVAHPLTIPEGKAPRAVVETAAVPEHENAPAESTPEGASLADLARRTRQAAHGEARPTLDSTEEQTTAPAGFQTFVLQYCRNPQQCSAASVVIPEKAEVVSRTNGQHIFKTALDGEPVMLYAGPADVNAPYRSLSDPDYIRMRDLANSNGSSREKPDRVSTQDLTIEDRPALMTRFRFQRDRKRWWIGERVLVGEPGEQFLLGCAAPEENFAEAEALCTTLVNSLRWE